MMFSLTALLCPLMVLAVMVTIIVLIVRSAGRRVPQGSTTPSVNVAAQIAPDGFWLSSLDPGSAVFYRYWAGGVIREGQIVFQPGNDGRHFVYTGMQPNNVEIIRVVGPSGRVVTGPVYVDDDSPNLMTPIVGAIAAQTVADAFANQQPEPPSPPPPQFPSAY